MILHSYTIFFWHSEDSWRHLRKKLFPANIDYPKTKLLEFLNRKIFSFRPGSFYQFRRIFSNPFLKIQIEMALTVEHPPNVEKVLNGDNENCFLKINSQPESPLKISLRKSLLGLFSGQYSCRFLCYLRQLQSRLSTNHVHTILQWPAARAIAQIAAIVSILLTMILLDS